MRGRMVLRRLCRVHPVLGPLYGLLVMGGGVWLLARLCGAALIRTYRYKLYLYFSSMATFGETIFCNTNTMLPVYSVLMAVSLTLSLLHPPVTFKCTRVISQLHYTAVCVLKVRAGSVVSSNHRTTRL